VRQIGTTSFIKNKHIKGFKHFARFRAGSRQNAKSGGNEWQSFPPLGRLLARVLDGRSRSVPARDIRSTMREADAEIVVQQVREAQP
jgi:hypothetical protein